MHIIMPRDAATLNHMCYPVHLEAFMDFSLSISRQDVVRPSGIDWCNGKNELICQVGNYMSGNDQTMRW